MVRGNRDNCNGNYSYVIMNVGGMQLFKISNNDSSEKILPKSKEVALRLIYIYTGLTALCAMTYYIFGMTLLIV